MAFGIEELFGAYQLGKNASYGRYYLSSRSEFDALLIEMLPDSDAWVNTYVVVSGNFMFGTVEATATLVPWNTGTPGLSLPLSCPTAFASELFSFVHAFH